MLVLLWLLSTNVSQCLLEEEHCLSSRELSQVCATFVVGTTFLPLPEGFVCHINCPCLAIQNPESCFPIAENDAHFLKRGLCRSNSPSNFLLASSMWQLKLSTCSTNFYPIFRSHRSIFSLLIITMHLDLVLSTESPYSSLFSTTLSRRACSFSMLSANRTISSAYLKGDWCYDRLSKHPACPWCDVR